MENKTAKVLTTIGVILFSISVLGFIVGIILETAVNPDVATILYFVAGGCAVAGIVITIIRFTKYGIPQANDQVIYYNVAPQRKEPKTVDVKPVKELTPEEKLFKQYKDLYKQKLISKEDLEAKRKELLGK